ncbi:sulfate reduction electron transfer complex DsrMKJOP subunit DsrO [Halarcobacter sp.]|uniref:sulfate reduction electron transfer complex DsrMKJOP subunit DsrO n=1 Tax=Halarcobacter sp. TaxID=2321133 RepID=UPI0029F45DB6|nr:4Fe-4S dicluster domain-containing protein [Halarcobacter sp.]
MDESKRNFIKGGLATLFVATTSAKAFSLKNPGRDEEDLRYIGNKNKQYAMVIDLRQCVGCQACTSACMVENDVPINQNRTSVTEMELGEFPDVRKAFLPQLCNHCDDPACVPVCPTGATFKREDGIVVVDSEICWGCGYCANACPYDKRFMNSKTKVMDKCTFCAHRVDEGLLPACVETCVGGARIFGDLNDKTSEVSKLLANYPTNTLKTEQGTKPQVFYIGLDGRVENVLNATANLDDIMRKEIGLDKQEWATMLGEK